MEANHVWKWRLTLFNQDGDWSDHCMTDFKMTVRADYAVSACSSLLLSIKALDHWLSVRKSQLSDRSSQHPPPVPCPAAGIHNKVNFSFHQPCLYNGFWVVSSQPPLSVTVSDNRKLGKWAFSVRVYVNLNTDYVQMFVVAVGPRDFKFLQCLCFSFKPWLWVILQTLPGRESGSRSSFIYNPCY